jgi:hypothetical protein
MSKLDKKLCSLAEDYITNEYYRVGNCSYAWEEWDDPRDDLSCHVESSELTPGDTENYSWWQVISNEIISSQVSDRNDATGEYCVKVCAAIAVSSGSGDEEVDETVEPEECTIYVQIDRDEEGNFCVVGTEE